ncbi:MAG: helix-turn-helix domain-containing protein [Candidatus Micrarchaeota archaeon]|nr:helix-turn-helix domain-containing protein [Candidatus Micrarchaeota archaeon]
MPRRKKIILSKTPPDPVVIKLKNFNLAALKTKRKQYENELFSNVEQMIKEAENLHRQEKLDKARLKSLGFLSLDEAYEEVKKAGIKISRRAFGGRIERGSLRSEKIANRRVIPLPILQDWISVHSNFYSVKKAYEILKEHEKDLNLRAFIGRIEKNTIPSIKINTQRLIPKEIVESLTHVSKNYFDVAQAIKFLHENNIKIKRNAFERRLDRGRIPHVKIGGKRLIAKSVLEELVKKELELEQKKASVTGGPKAPFSPSIPKGPEKQNL